MKIVSFILAIYFLSLSVKTCADNAISSNNCKTVSCAYFQNEHADHHSTDLCSPLCTCSCCGGITLPSESLHHFKADLTPFQKPLYSENSISEITYSIWQPPKI